MNQQYAQNLNEGIGTIHSMIPTILIKIVKTDSNLNNRVGVGVVVVVIICNCNNQSKIKEKCSRVSYWI